MASMLSGIPLAARGPAQIFIFDIHALQERFYFTDLVIPRSVVVMYGFQKHVLLQRWFMFVDEQVQYR